jgi:NADH-quinone oxidoreductase subunit E
MSDSNFHDGVSGPPFEQPASFEFTSENLEKAKHHIAKYPHGRQASAVLPLLDLAQRQHDNWLPRAAMDKVAQILDMAPIRVYEVATFYTMFNLRPVGRWFLQACTTTPCWLRGSDELVAACRKKLGIGVGESTADGQFTLVEVECLGACVDGASTVALLDALAAGKPPPIGSVTGRQGSMPATGATTLTAMAPAQNGKNTDAG